MAPPPAARPSGPPAAPVAPGIAATYHDVATRLIAEGLRERGAHRRLTYLAEQIGARPTGSAALTKAVAWFQDELRADGQERVAAEPVTAPAWVRGTAKAAIVAPVKQPLRLLALGRSPATPHGGVRGQVVVVDGFEQLDALGAAGVRGKIVLFNHVMPPYTVERGSGYGAASPIRMKGPARAAALGAKAALVRSLTARIDGTPHAGLTTWGADPKAPRIPAAAIATEDADTLARLAAAGRVEVTLTLTSKVVADVATANVVGELRGRERPDEVVLIGAHSDSWDVGQGAHDDGAGCVMMIEALAILRRAGLTPRRTIRVVLFTNEESGSYGADAYLTAHAAELPLHVAAFEADSGGYAPRGLRYSGGADDAALARTRELVTLLAPLGAASVEVGYAGQDIEDLDASVTARFGVAVDGATYFDLHHSEHDTIDKVDARDLQANAVVMAIVAYVIADWPERWTAPLAPPSVE